MTRALVALLLVTAVAGCREYDFYPRLSDQSGLLDADTYAAYTKEAAQSVAIGRKFAQEYRGTSFADRKAQTDATVAYAQSLPGVATVVADTIGYRLTVTFKNGWRAAVVPIADGKAPEATPNLPGGPAAAQ